MTDLLTIIDLDHITLRWEGPVDPELCLALGVVANHAAAVLQPEVEKAVSDMIVHGVGIVGPNIYSVEPALCHILPAEFFQAPCRG